MSFLGTKLLLWNQHTKPSFLLLHKWYILTWSPTSNFDSWFTALFQIPPNSGNFSKFHCSPMNNEMRLIWPLFLSSDCRTLKWRFEDKKLFPLSYPHKFWNVLYFRTCIDQRKYRTSFTSKKLWLHRVTGMCLFISDFGLTQLWFSTLMLAVNYVSLTAILFSLSASAHSRIQDYIRYVLKKRTSRHPSQSNTIPRTNHWNIEPSHLTQDGWSL